MKKNKPLRIDILTLFPEACSPYLQASILGRAQREKKLDLRVHQLRDFSRDKRGRVDEKPFGGGAGMVMQIQPFHAALMALKVRTKKGTPTAAAKKTRVIVTSAKGKIFTQQDAQRLAAYDRLVFLCGRYEGIDQRVSDHLADEELSIGQFVLTGGELPAMVMTDAVSRLRPGVLGAEESLAEESWSHGQDVEYPQYTRPESYLGWDVPEVLLSGDHGKIKHWRDGARGESDASTTHPSQARSKPRQTPRANP